MHFLVAAALFVASNPAVVSTDIDAAPKPAKAKKICKVDPSTNGSRMAKSICLTAEQWDERNSKGKSMEDVKSGLVR